MDITLDKKNATEASIKITLKEADYQPKVEEKVKEYSKTANLKGFRPGKVPPALVRKMYGKSILVDEINHLVSHSVNDYIKDNKLQILGEPLPDESENKQIDWDQQKEFEFAYNIGLVDDFNYELSDKVKVTRYQITIGDKELNETIDNIREQAGKMTNPEVSQDGDTLFGELKEVDGEFKQTVLLPIHEMEKKEQKKFIGLKKEDEVVFDLRKAFKDEDTIARVFDKSIQEVQALKSEVSLTLQNINRKEPAEMNQEFFDKVFGPGAVSSEEEFRNKVKETISENYERETAAYLDQTIEKKFLETTEVQLPDEFLKRWLLLSNEGKVSMEDIEKEYETFAKNTQWTLIKNKIAEDNEIKVENEDVVEKAKNLIRNQFAGSGLGTQLEDSMDSFVETYLKGENGDNYMNVFTQVRTEKINDLIKDKIHVETKTVDVEEFKKIVAK